MEISAVNNSTNAVSSTPADRNEYAITLAAHSDPAQADRRIRGTVAVQPI